MKLVPDSAWNARVPLSQPIDSNTPPDHYSLCSPTEVALNSRTTPASTGRSRTLSDKDFDKEWGIADVIRDCLV